MGDFNIDLLKFDSSEHINKFINDLPSNCSYLHIILPTQISDNNKTVIDHIFSNITEPLIKYVVTGNITFSISDQFFFLPDFFLIIIPTMEMRKYMTGADLIRTCF